jgi:hypothetical protein
MHRLPAASLLQAFDQISPTARGSSSYAAAAPAGLAPPQHNPFAVGPTAEAVRSQLGGMTVGGTGAVGVKAAHAVHAVPAAAIVALQLHTLDCAFNSS